MTSGEDSVAAAALPPASLRLRRLLERAGPHLTLLLIVGLWEACCRLFAVPAYVLPAPSAIFAAAVAGGWQLWLTNIAATVEIALLGYAAAILIGIPLAILLTLSELLASTLFPLLVIVQSTPIVAIAPVIVVVLGTDEVPRVLITFLISFFPIVVGTATGLRATPSELIELSRSLRAGRRREYTQIRLPYAVPYIFSALKVSVTLSVIGAVVAEFVAAERGLGFGILFATSLFKLPEAFASLILLVLVSLLAFRGVQLVERRCFGWSVQALHRE
jgi:NitT/TauT family transport system permease protein